MRRPKPKAGKDANIAPDGALTNQSNAPRAPGRFGMRGGGATSGPAASSVRAEDGQPCHDILSSVLTRIPAATRVRVVAGGGPLLADMCGWPSAGNTFCGPTNWVRQPDVRAARA